MTRVRGALLLAVVLGASAPAVGQPPPEAARLFPRCLAAADAENSAEALACFQKVYALFPSPVVLKNIGRTHERLGNLVDAYDAYQRCLLEPEGPLKRDEKQKVRAWLGGVALRLALVTVRPVVPGARVFVDGKPRGAVSPNAFPMMPGARDVRVEAPGHKPWSTTVIMGAGESRVLSATLQPLAVAAALHTPDGAGLASQPATSPSGGPASSPPSGPRGAGSSRDEGWRPPAYAPWVAFGIAAVAVGVGTYFGARFLDRGTGLGAAAASGKAATACFSVAGAAALTGGGLLLWRYLAPQRQPVVAIGPGSFVVALAF
jgi:hypothetical protein